MKVLDDTGNLVPELSLVHMLEQCHDFLNEMSQLEHVSEQLKTKALITTKYYCEFAGKGIKYSWGVSKSIYRRSPLKMKRGKDNFDKLVAKCISRNFMKKEIIRRFSKCATQYMLSYQALEMHSDEVHSTNLQQFSYQKNERMKTFLQSHREVLNFDKDFVASRVSAIDFDWNEEVDHVVKKKQIKRKRGIN